MKLLVLALAVAVASALTLHEEEFSNYVTKFDRKYESVEEMFNRFQIFQENKAKVEAHNALNKSWKMALNEFADMTAEEFKDTMLGFVRGPPLSFLRSKNGPVSPITAAPGKTDWRTKNAVTPVKNQMQCGSCWAFSTTGSLEGAMAITTGTLTSLSEQELVDCAGSSGNQGCNGGLMDYAFEWIQQNGLCSEADYRYTGMDGQCRMSTCTPVVKPGQLTGYTDVPSGDEQSLLAAVAQQPVSVAIEADQAVFQFYSGGILDNPGCGTQLDHGVLAVGYDNTNNPPYWIVKNSWGSSWGESGYIRMVYGKNECGITLASSYPTVSA